MGSNQQSTNQKSQISSCLFGVIVRLYGLLIISLVKNGNNRFPAQIEDVKKVLAFISKNAKKYKYNGEEYALMGGSAGGHLAMLYAYGYDEK